MSTYGVSRDCVAQQEAFEDAEFLHNLKSADDRLEAEFLYPLYKTDAIVESQKESKRQLHGGSRYGSMGANRFAILGAS